MYVYETKKKAYKYKHKYSHTNTSELSNYSVGRYQVQKLNLLMVVHIRYC